MALPFPTSTVPASPLPVTVRPARPHLVVIEGGAATSAGGSSRPTARTYAMRRALVVAVAAVATLTAVGAWRAATPGEPAAPRVAASYSVAPGDSLWSIVERLGLEGDRQEIVARIGEANGGTVIRPGDRLVIPADVTAG